jgi:hypothetical protein
MKRIQVRLYLENGKIKELRSDRFIRRILSTISLTQFTKAYIKVRYGMKLDNFGKRTMFYNDGWYTDKKELKDIIKVFWNEG